MSLPEPSLGKRQQQFDKLNQQQQKGEEDELLKSTQNTYSMQFKSQWHKNKSSIIIAILVLATIYFSSSYIIQFYQNSQISKQFQQTVINMFKGGQKQGVSSPYIGIDAYAPFPQLPICIIVTNATLSLQIQDSIQSQNFKNYQTVYILEQTNNKIAGSNILISPIMNYQTIKKGIQKFCQPEALILMAENPLAPGSLQKLNQVYQRQYIYMGYQANEGQIKVHSFYRRVYQLIEINNFEGKNSEWLFHNNAQVSRKAIGKALIQLCLRRNLKLQTSKIFKSQNNPSTLQISLNQWYDYSKSFHYQQLFSLHQDYEISLRTVIKNWNKFLQNKQAHYNGFVAPEEQGITQKKGFEAFQERQLLYLPSSHSLATREYSRYNQKYNISQFQNHQLSMCVTVPSFNNIPKDRYKKVMLSLLKQQYNNFNIVFIDDFSTDHTFYQTWNFLLDSKFAKERITYVRNLQSKLATYNIVHAAHSYCQKGSIQIILDGDDCFIGNNVLKLFNAIYHKQDVWIAYTNYISTRFSYGMSVQVNHQLDSNEKGQRPTRIGHFMGTTRSWRTQLMASIPLMYHQSIDGKWFNTNYDDAFFISLYEKSGPERILYIPQITYLYSIATQNSDASTFWKRFHRTSTRKSLSSYTPNKKLGSFEEAVPDKEVRNVFQRQKGIKFIQYTFKAMSQEQQNNKYKGIKI